MRHRTTKRFWKAYGELSPDLQKLADDAFELLQMNPRHPSLHFKPVNGGWSVRVNQDFRALALEDGSDLAWFWIGPHDVYTRLIKSL